MKPNKDSSAERHMEGKKRSGGWLQVELGYYKFPAGTRLRKQNREKLYWLLMKFNLIIFIFDNYLFLELYIFIFRDVFIVKKFVLFFL